jgi:phenylalanyl-tRNA synthetase beta chain
MKLPFSWLSEFVDLSGLSAQAVADRLTMGAFEVEEVKSVGPDLVGPIVVGEIQEISAHPNADKIRLTKIVIDEQAAPLEIVCGAQNIEVGQRIPVALPGSRVLNRHDGSELPIRVTKIRGVQSNGMLCSPPELGIVNGAGDGILILPKTASFKLGADAKELLALYKDEVLHVAPRSNRGDALSIFGLAREVAALFRRPLKQQSWNADFPDSDLNPFTVTIEDEHDCELFTVRYLYDLQVRESEPLIKRRLEIMGLRPVNNIVDITNYVMLEYGQPLHAYDANHVRGNQFAVRRAKNQEILKTIDGKDRALSSELLIIADAVGSIGVAGVMGGIESEVTNATVAVALEAAKFNSARVRRASRLLGLSSEASLRFERSIDLNAVKIASDRAAFLMLQHCSAEKQAKAGAFSSKGKFSLAPKEVTLRTNQIERILGITISAEQIADFLKPLGFDLIAPINPESNPSRLTFAVPSFRQADVTREVDLVEEVGRMFGYDQIPDSMPTSTIAASSADPLINQIRTALWAQGLSEAYVSSLVPKESSAEGSVARISLCQDETTLVRVLNPLSKEHQVLRQSLLPGLLRALSNNQDHGYKEVWLFEIGRVYFKSTSTPAGEPLSPEKFPGLGRLVEERRTVAAVLNGGNSLSQWLEHHSQAPTNSTAKNTVKSAHCSNNSVDFFLTKGIVENLLSTIDIDVEKIAFLRPQLAHLLFHPAKSAAVIWQASPQEELRETPETEVSTVKLGTIGQIHPAQAKLFNVDELTCLFEINIDALAAYRRSEQPLSFSLAPAVTRDLTVDLNAEIDQAAVFSTIKRASGALFKALELISIYHLEDEMRSLSYRITFQHPEQTLRSEVVDAQIEQIRQALASRLTASFRS